MKLFYTRQEVEEKIEKALIDRDQRRNMEESMANLHREIYKLEERIARLEWQRDSGPETPSCCSTMKGSEI